MRRLLISFIILAGALLICGEQTFAWPSNQATPAPCTQGTLNSPPNIAVVVLLQNSKHMNQAQPGAATIRMADARRAAIGLAAVLDPQHDVFGLVTYSQNADTLLPLARADGGCVANVVGANTDQPALVNLTSAMQQASDMLSQSHAKRNVIVIIGASCEDTASAYKRAGELACQPSTDASNAIIELSKKADLSIYAIGVGRDTPQSQAKGYYDARHDELKAYTKLLSPANPLESNHFVAYDQDNPEWYAFLRQIISNPTSAPATSTPMPTLSATPSPATSTPTPTLSATPSPATVSGQDAGSSLGWSLVAFFVGLLLAGASAFVILVRTVEPRTVNSARAPHIERNQPILVVQNGLPDAKHEVYLLTGDSISIGSDLTNTIQLPEEAGVRKQHVRLERMTNGSASGSGSYTVTVVGASSTDMDRTSINNKPIRPSQNTFGMDAHAELALNDLLTVGKISLQYLAWPVDLQPPKV